MARDRMVDDTLLMRPRTDDGRLRRGPGFRARRLTAPLRRSPDFLVLGAMKSGTSSLFHHMLGHPGIEAPCRKEVHYFGLGRHAGRGSHWYRAHFPPRWPLGRAALTGEATPDYLYDEDAARRIHADLPDARLIVILREPADRAVSQYHHEVRAGRETHSIERAFALEEARLAFAAQLGDVGRETLTHAGYRRRGVYADQISRYMTLFARERLLILGFGALKRDPSGTLAKVFAFLGLPPADIDGGVIRNGGGDKPPPPAALMEEMRDWFQPHNRRLERMLGGLPDW